MPDREQECRPEQPIAANSLFRRMDSLFGQRDSLFSEEQGMGRKLLNPFGDRLQNHAKEAGIA